MSDLERVRVLVVGDSGVGKTALTNLICHGAALNNPGWTVGCSVEVKLHEYLEGTVNQKTYCIELWDIGGSHAHRNTRHVFYNVVHGIILVHDLSNRKSCLNLNRWLAEVTRCESGSGKFGSRGGGGGGTAAAWEDGNISGTDIGEVAIPLLVMGTKMDSAQEKRGLPTHQKRSDIAEEFGVEEIHLNTGDPSGLAAGTSSAAKLTRFFDKVIEKQFTDSRRKGSLTHIQPTDRRRMEKVPSVLSDRTSSLQFSSVLH
ncbi:rab-like protein 3 [Eurytemora carolleeae]|uniref:rab-like protein 3 n=1 Tax=Eurytemora carolleeae TaxID=1294199 RepID=UPI000C77F80B|nr:rab-like protein 3 [Eurytemora carolleeae]|eukprot:XP_023328945.1 rab-like protein 3 [Eurytemora affinis]